MDDMSLILQMFKVRNIKRAMGKSLLAGGHNVI